MAFIEHINQQRQNIPFFSRTHGTVTKIAPILGHKTIHNKFKGTKIIKSIFSDNNTIKVEINYREKSGNFPNIWKLSNIVLNNP